MERPPVAIIAIWVGIIVLVIVVKEWAGAYWSGVLLVSLGALMLLGTALLSLPAAGELRKSARSALPNGLVGLAVVALGLDDLMPSLQGSSRLVGGVLLALSFIVRRRDEDTALSALLDPRHPRQEHPGEGRESQ